MCSDSPSTSRPLRDPIIRAAATATLCDMAKLDLLRDIEEIVGWIQNRLNDEEPAVVHFSLLTLKHLVFNEELEFDLVIRVLEKRLNVNMTDKSVVLGWNSLVLESFVMLLGEGGVEEEDSDNDAEQDDYAAPQITQQSAKAVSLLVELALSSELSLVEDDTERQHFDYSKTLIQRSTYSSLAGYSSQLLGLDSESIRRWNGIDMPGDDSEEGISISRYVQLREIALAGLQFTSQMYDSNDETEVDKEAIATDFSESVASIITTLVLFEEEVHGSFLFKGSSPSSTNKSDMGKTESRHRLSKAVVSSLPVLSMVQELFEDEPSPATATSFLCGTVGNDLANTKLSEILDPITECLSDIEPFADPSIQAIQISSIMLSMENVWKYIEMSGVSSKECFDEVVSQLEKWAETIGEYSHIALTSFALAVDEATQLWPSIADDVTTLQSKILEGRDNYLFESEDTKVLCISLIAAKMSRSADARVSEQLDFIEQSLLSHGGQSFGSLFGLAILVRHIFKDGRLNRSDPSDVWRQQQVQRIVSIFLVAINTCLAEQSESVSAFALAIKNGESSDDYVENDVLLVNDNSIAKMRCIMIGLGHTFSALSEISPVMTKGLLSVVENIPWKAGRAFALSAGYKSCIESGVLDQDCLTTVVTKISDLIQYSDGGSDRGEQLFALASMCSFSSDKAHTAMDLVKGALDEVLGDGSSSGSRDEKSMSILAGVALVGDVPGITSLNPNVYITTKKDLVIWTVELLKGIPSNESVERKVRDTSAIGLGALCALRRSSYTMKNARKAKSDKSSADRRLNFGHLIQAKDGSMMFSILNGVNNAHTVCVSTIHGDKRRIAATKKLSILLTTLQPIAMPGSFARIIEVILNDAHESELELKASCIELLTCQLESRRRVGSDRRGFLDLAARLAKITPLAINELMGVETVPSFVKALPDILRELPTSVGEEIARNVWTICLVELKSQFSGQSASEFLTGIKALLVSSNMLGQSGQKHSTSPALIRFLQKLVVTSVFDGLCTTAAPCDENATMSNTQQIWEAFRQCLEFIPQSDTDTFQSDITRDNLFGMAVCSGTLKGSTKVSRKVEAFIARQEWKDNEGQLIALYSTLAIAPHCSNELEMKESVLSLFEVMLVKGVDTLCMELLAVKIAFWWESQQLTQLDVLDTAVQRVSNMSSFLLTGNASFAFQSLDPKQLIEFANACIEDLPAKLAVLCKMWKISNDVANRATRIWSASLDGRNDVEEQSSQLLQRSDRALACMKDIVEYVNGGEVWCSSCEQR